MSDGVFIQFVCQVFRLMHSNRLNGYNGYVWLWKKK
jgi:hypothetical protein